MPRSPRRSQRERVECSLGGRCWYCGGLPEDLTVDHARPRSRGGKNEDGNLLPACDRCNNLKANQTVSEFRKWVKVRVIRRALTEGFHAGDLSRIRVVFYGEGEPNPWAF